MEKYCNECYEKDNVIVEMELHSDYRNDVDVYVCECGHERVWNRGLCEWEDEINDCGNGFGIEVVYG